MPETHESEIGSGEGGGGKTEKLEPKIKIGRDDGNIAHKFEIDMTLRPRSYQYHSLKEASRDDGGDLPHFSEDKLEKILELVKNMKRRPRDKKSSASMDGGVFEMGAGYSCEY